MFCWSLFKCFLFHLRSLVFAVFVTPPLAPSRARPLAFTPNLLALLQLLLTLHWTSCHNLLALHQLRNLWGLVHEVGQNHDSAHAKQLGLRPGGPIRKAEGQSLSPTADARSASRGRRRWQTKRSACLLRQHHFFRSGSVGGFAPVRSDSDERLLLAML